MPVHMQGPSQAAFSPHTLKAVHHRCSQHRHASRALHLLLCPDSFMHLPGLTNCQPSTESRLSDTRCGMPMRNTSSAATPANMKVCPKAKPCPQPHEPTLCWASPAPSPHLHETAYSAPAGPPQASRGLPKAINRYCCMGVCAPAAERLLTRHRAARPSPPCLWCSPHTCSDVYLAGPARQESIKAEGPVRSCGGCRRRSPAPALLHIVPGPTLDTHPSWVTDSPTSRAPNIPFLSPTLAAR